ncbi:MAG: hypothetical protein HQK56_17110 [Deltaproteobacteria bacterium]|nr:hypothetical protein [Deltaproteobacteria bacterium]
MSTNLKPWPFLIHIRLWWKALVFDKDPWLKLPTIDKMIYVPDLNIETDKGEYLVTAGYARVEKILKFKRVIYVSEIPGYPLYWDAIKEEQEDLHKEGVKTHIQICNREYWVGNITEELKSIHRKF